MSRYVPRTTIPDPTDLNWIKTTYGGYNYCILGNPSYATGSVLANCVGYAWGRWRELLGAYHNLSRGNASTWYGNTSDGYARGSEPKLGAVICWDGGSDGSGHVAIVEEIAPDRSWIKTSNSAYGGSYYYNQTLYRSNNWTWSSNYTFQGFIYSPIDWESQQYIPIKKRIHRMIVKVR